MVVRRRSTEPNGVPISYQTGHFQLAAFLSLSWHVKIEHAGGHTGRKLAFRVEGDKPEIEAAAATFYEDTARVSPLKMANACRDLRGRMAECFRVLENAGAIPSSRR